MGSVHLPCGILVAEARICIVLQDHLNICENISPDSKEQSSSFDGFSGRGGITPVA